MNSTTELRRGVVLPGALLLSLAAAQPANALLFEPREVDGIGWVLEARDCGIFEHDDARGCDGWERRFNRAGLYPDRHGIERRYHGDPEELRRRLSQRRFAEVWLVSGGGNLFAGIEMGRILRQHQMTVRVPAGMHCASACTVAFMGGFFRFLSPGATYEVHAASVVGDGVDREIVALAERGEFQEIARSERIAARYIARALLTHFQNTLTLPLNRQQPEDNTAFRRWAGQNIPPRPFYTEEHLQQDRRRVQAEGPAAVQDIIMRIERDAMQAAIADLRDLVRHNRLGPRADAALRMVEAMYDVSIRETAVLTRETMLRMGYITEELPTQRRN
jgi:hypothetical protein